MKRLIHFIAYSKAASYVAALLCVVSWCVQVEEKTLTDLLWLMSSLVAGYLLVRVNREFSLGDTRSPLPATLFFMGCSIVPDYFAQYTAGLHAVLFPMACYMLLSTYREREAMGRYFLAFTFVGIQCLLAPPLLFTLPLLVLCGMFMGSLHVRTLLASLWGLLFPFWMMCGVLFLMGRVGVVPLYFEQLVSTTSVPFILQTGLRQWGMLLWVLLIALPGSIGILFNRTMKLQASAGFRLLIGVLAVSLVTMSLPTACSSVLFPCVLMTTALIGSAMFTGNGSRAKDIFFIILLLIWLFFLGLPLWSNFWTR